MKRPVRVALVHQRFHLGGSIERDAVFLARGLARAGVEVHCYGDAGHLDADLEGAAFHPVTPVGRGSSRLRDGLERGSFAVRATRAVRRDRRFYDVVHVSSTSAWEHDVVTVHQVVVADQRRWPEEAGQSYRLAPLRATLAPVLRPALGVARAVQHLQFRDGHFRRLIAVTDAVRDDLVETFGVRREQVSVIPYHIDASRLADLEPDGRRRQLGVPDGAGLVLFVGHDFERKGLGDAIAALAGVESAHLVVVGGGNQSRFAHQAAELGVTGRIHFVGETSAPEPWYAEADVLVLPTLHDPWGIAIVEAMAAGLPVVTTRAAGASSVVEGADAGVVVPERAPRELADALRSLLRDPARRHALGEHGRGAAVRYDSRAYGAAVLEVYEDILRGEGAA